MRGRFAPISEDHSTEPPPALPQAFLRNPCGNAGVVDESEYCFALPMNPPPYLPCFDSISELRGAIGDAKFKEHERQIKFLIDRNMPLAIDAEIVGALFGYSPAFIIAMAKKPDRYYRRFQIKKGSKMRTITSPRVSLKAFQSWFGHHLSRSVDFEDCVHGFVPGRSSLTAADIHCRAKWVFSTDIENFFETTSQDQVGESLMDIGYTFDASRMISQLCTYRGHLAVGSPASPVLSNCVFRPYDRKLLQLSEKHDIRYTRYADDLVFTGDGAIPKKLQKRVRAVIDSGNWNQSTRKTQLVELPLRLKVHGLLVHHDNIRLTKGYRRRLRAIQHQIDLDIVADELYLQALGHLSYRHAVRLLRKDYGYLD